MAPNRLRLADLFKYYKHGTPHQMAAVAILEEELIKVAPHILDRSQTWYKTWMQAGKRNDYDPAIKLIKEFEGCCLSAYPDPLSGGEPYTIGYGTTKGVKRGDLISVPEAEKFLERDVQEIADKLRNTIPFFNAMTIEQRSALISFAYNLGANFFNAPGFETISRVLADKHWALVPQTFELYRNPGTSVEAGLLRRRRAEGALWAKNQVQSQRVTPNSSFATSLTPHIRLGEFALDDEERRFNRQDQVDIALELATFLERVRQQFNGKPIFITSGYRPPDVNRRVGGAIDSEHLYKKGCGAVDFSVIGADIYQVQSWCDKNWQFSLGYGAYKGFVHLGIRSTRQRIRWNY